jgi:hypothetical protein
MMLTALPNYAACMDSNPRPDPYRGPALPTELTQQFLVDHLGVEPSKDGLQGLPALRRAALVQSTRG